LATYLASLFVVLQPLHLLALIVSAVVGCILGAIPGLSGGMGITLILPMTFALEPEISFIMLLAMYVAAFQAPLLQLFW